MAYFEHSKMFGVFLVVGVDFECLSSFVEIFSLIGSRVLRFGMILRLLMIDGGLGDGVSVLT